MRDFGLFVNHRGSVSFTPGAGTIWLHELDIVNNKINRL